MQVNVNGGARIAASQARQIKFFSLLPNAFVWAIEMLLVKEEIKYARGWSSNEGGGWALKPSGTGTDLALVHSRTYY
jgi:hypothetical protein